MVVNVLYTMSSVTIWTLTISWVCLQKNQKLCTKRAYMYGMGWQLLIHLWLHATLEVSYHNTTSVKKIWKSLLVCSILRIKSWVGSHWILILVVVDLIFNSTTMVPYLARYFQKMNIDSDIFKCSLLTNDFELEDEFWLL
jgi:hypothetical protein